MKLESTRKSLICWSCAFVLSIVLNMFLFDLMAYMIKRKNPGLRLPAIIERIDVVRIKREKNSVKQEVEKEKKPEEKLKPLLKKTVYTVPKTKVKLKIPFELNPKLPPLDDCVKIPFHSFKKVDLPELKSVFGLAELDRPITPLIRIPPVYPLRAKRLGIEGWVKVRFIVDRKGRVKDIKVIESKPKGVFEETTIRAVSRWKFTPGTVEGIPVKTLVETTIRFKLE